MRSRELARLVKDAADRRMLEVKTMGIVPEIDWQDESPYVYVDRGGIRSICFPDYLTDHRPPLASIDVVTASMLSIKELTNDLIEQFWMQEHD